MKKTRASSAKHFRNADSQIMRLIQKNRHKYITRFMRLMTKIGDGWLWILICAIGLVVNLDAGLALSFSLAIQVVLQSGLKHIFSRKRPYIKHKDLTNLMLPPDRFSFPSGHTLAAFTLAFVFMFYYPPLYVPMVILASLVGVSRIYLGLHYPSDVLIAVVLGFVCAWLGVELSLLLVF